jgi:predicted kinase
MDRPTIVLVDGAPGSGKTTLARQLAPQLKLPLISKDEIKEVLLNTLGAASRNQSRELGAATFALLFTMLSTLIQAKVGAVVDCPFHRGRSELELQPIVQNSRTVIVYCKADSALTGARYRERFEKGDRHAGHFDAEVLPELLAALDAGEYQPLALDVPTLLVDTTDGYRPVLPEILAFISARTG